MNPQDFARQMMGCKPLTVEPTSNPSLINVVATCPSCGKKQSLTGISREKFNQWQAGTLVQIAFPDLTPSQREALITGICDDCFPKGEPEDEEEPESDPEDNPMSYSPMFDDPKE